jgi:hypothetical protein
MEFSSLAYLALALLVLKIQTGFNVNMSEASFDQILKSGSMNGYLTYDEFYHYINQIRDVEGNKRYISNDQIFGKTYEGRELSGFYITDDTTQIEKYLSHKNILIINALHHAREPLTLTMMLLIVREILKMLNSKKHSKIKEFLRDNIIFIIPVVNIDSYLYINKHFSGPKGKEVRMIRKNRRIHPQCNEITGGVDLNRNYDFKFGINETGSSSNPCAEDYRGERPFSEQETASIKKYVDDNKNVISAVNVHTYGNSWIYPFNYVSDKSDHFLQMKKRLFYDFYKEFEKDIAGKQIRALFGNAAFTLDYPTNGEAGDWFTGKKNIMNIDVELGNNDPASEQFYPPRRIISDIVRYNWLVMKEFFYKHIVALIHQIIVTRCGVVFVITNTGISNLIDFEGTITIDIPAANSGYKLSYSLRDLPTAPEIKIPVIDNKISTTLKGRHILSIHVTLKNKAERDSLKGLHLEIARNQNFLHYPNQSYYFKFK